jgi:predicted AAA+ superfamily ATPase
MMPLTYKEVEGFDLESVMTSGMLPPHFLSSQPLEDLRSYLGDYLKEEIATEAQVQNIPVFSDFLRVAAVTSSELLNYTNVAREVGLSQHMVRTYFDILEDTLLGFRVAPWKKSKTRRMILTEKFYLFDVGVSNYLMNRHPRIGSPEFGKSFEHLMLMELRAYQAYKDPEMDIRYWRSAAGQEIDFILGDKQLAIEVKSSARVHEGDLGAFNALAEDGPVRKRLFVSQENQPKTLDKNIEVLPWKMFLDRLWDGDLGV